MGDRVRSFSGSGRSRISTEQATVARRGFSSLGVRWSALHFTLGPASIRMEPTTLLYTATVIGSIALYLVLRPGRAAVRVAAGFCGLGAAAWIIGNLPQFFSDTDGSRPQAIFAVFALVAIGAAGRMITHSRPVYSALHFILVVIASAGMFLLLSAEFMAFALVIVYAGAILVTYMFVLMLAQQAPDPNDPDAAPEYDRVPREPFAAVTVGFIMLALLGNLSATLDDTLPPPATESQANVVAWNELSRMPVLLESYAEDLVGDDVDGVALPVEDGSVPLLVSVDGMTAQFDCTVETENGPETREIMLSADEHLPGNTQRVGMALVAEFPVSLELAGIILLMAMFGAVVLARRQQELGEDVVREAAGMRALTVDTEHETDTDEEATS